MDSHHLCSSMHDCFSAAPSRISKTSLQDRPANPYIINGKVVIEHSPGLSGPGKSASLQLYSSTELDPSKLCLAKLFIYYYIVILFWFHFVHTLVIYLCFFVRKNSKVFMILISGILYLVIFDLLMTDILPKL